MGENEDSEEAWFRPRRFGYGFTPVSDKGVIACVMVMIALTLCICLPALIMGPSFAALVASAISFVVVLGLFIVIAWKHTDRSL